MNAGGQSNAQIKSRAWAYRRNHLLAAIQSTAAGGTTGTTRRGAERCRGSARAAEDVVTVELHTSHATNNT
jgi:hypothetical protein